MVLVLIDVVLPPPPVRYVPYYYYLPPYDPKIPLLGVDIQGEIIDFVGEVKIRQRFRNDHGRNIEAKYLFNLDDNSTVTGMVMVIGGRRLVSEIKEKTEGREIYETAISEGKTTCLLEKASNGIYTVNVGNILAGEEVVIEVDYVTQLDCSDEGEMKFLLPTNISPKYEGDSHKTVKDMQASTATTSQLTYATTPLPYAFHVNLNWKSNATIEEVKSLTNEIEVTGIHEKAVNIQCKTAPRNGDFNVFVRTSEIGPTFYVKKTREGETFLMVNHRIADMMQEMEGGDFTILVDRSGSMGSGMSRWSGGVGSGSGSGKGRGGDGKSKMDFAREACRLFVQSLPAGCKFNVVSFGSSYETIFPSSVEYTNVTKKQALEEISRFQANLGGTELFQCLSDVLSGQRNRNAKSAVAAPAVDLSKRSWKPGSSTTAPTSTSTSSGSKAVNEKIVILMTDGDVGNVDAVVSLIREYNYKSRVFTIGIGQDVNRFLCERIASASNASCEIMIDNPNISTVVAKMLDSSTKSYYRTSILTVNGRDVIFDKPIYPNKFTTFYHKIPTAEFLSCRSINLSSVDGLTGKNVNWTFELNGEVVKEEEGGGMDCIRQLYAADLIRRLEENNQDNRKTGEIIRLSVDYGVMNARTSFVVVDEMTRISKNTFISRPKPVVVPQASSLSIPQSSFAGGRAGRNKAANLSIPQADFFGGRGGGGMHSMSYTRSSAAPLSTSSLKPQKEMARARVMKKKSSAGSLLRFSDSRCDEGNHDDDDESESDNEEIPSVSHHENVCQAPAAPAASESLSEEDVLDGLLEFKN